MQAGFAVEIFIQLAVGLRVCCFRKDFFYTVHAGETLMKQLQPLHSIDSMDCLCVISAGAKLALSDAAESRMPAASLAARYVIHGG